VGRLCLVGLLVGLREGRGLAGVHEELQQLPRVGRAGQCVGLRRGAKGTGNNRVSALIFMVSVGKGDKRGWVGGLARAAEVREEEERGRDEPGTPCG
jgi:hypothetical protein